MSIKLIIEERYYQSTPFIILFIFFSACIFFVFYNPEIRSTKKIVRKISRSRTKPVVDFEQIYASKDPVDISHVVEILRNNGITCYIFDENASGLMKFLLEVEIRVLVPKDDYGKSIALVNEIMQQMEQAEAENEK